jgi:hypothetical protein
MKRLLEDFSSSKAALLTNAVSNQALAGGRFIAQRKKRNRANRDKSLR